MAKEAKETYYFSHDSNALTDTKILNMRADYGIEGYGLYWAIIEMLRNEKDYKLNIDKSTYRAIKILTNTTIEIEDFINDCIEDYKLFEKEEEKFYSKSLFRRMEQKEEKSAIAREKANRRWNSNNKTKEEKQCSNNTVAMQQQCSSNATAEEQQCNSNAEAMQEQCNSNTVVMQQQCSSNANKGKENKEKESKENKNKINKNKEDIAKKFIDENNHLIDEKFEDETLKNTLRDFIKMRKAIKKPLTERALELIIKELYKLSQNVDEQIKILEKSIVSNWQDIYPLNKSSTTTENRNYNNYNQREHDNLNVFYANSKFRRNK